MCEKGILWGVLTVEVSVRHEAGNHRAYVWLSDGTIVGYRDLDTGEDFLTSAQHGQLLQQVLPNWLSAYGVNWVGAPAEPEMPPMPPGRGPVAWLNRRRTRRQHSLAVAAHQDWRLDRPRWKVPMDSPEDGWRDLVRNEPGDALWQHATNLPERRWFEVSARREDRAWTTGARGEEAVGAELWRVSRPSSWRYVHSVPVGRRNADIDHVLVGPGGVFTLNTKSHAGARVWVGEKTFMVNGHKQPYLRNSLYEAARASRLLTAATGRPVTARGVIVLVDPASLTIKKSPPEVAVTTRRGLVRWTQSRPRVLSDDEIDSIFDYVRRSTTWA